MPGVTETLPEIAGAICAPPEGSSETVPVPVQPRQPANLQGLLRFAMEATKAEDAPNNSELGPMDDEKRKFLEEALKSMTIDVIEVLQTQIKILKNVDKLQQGDDITEYIEALETIDEYIDNIDIANDFHKIGGFMILNPCLKCHFAKIRAGVCELIAVLCQNNPYCQKIIMENGFLPELVNLLDTDPDIQVCIKALYAVSAIVRDNNEGFNQLIAYNGLVVFLKALQKKQEKIIVKVAFLLTALCKSQSDLRSRLIFLDYLPTLISLIGEERTLGHEFLLSLLVCIIEDNSTAIIECKKHNLKELLQKYMGDIRNKEECLEEEQYCRRLLHMLS